MTAQFGPDPNPVLTGSPIEVEEVATLVVTALSAKVQPSLDVVFIGLCMTAP